MEIQGFLIWKVIFISIDNLKKSKDKTGPRHVSVYLLSTVHSKGF